jgi:hypothetical protein
MFRFGTNPPLHEAVSITHCCPDSAAKSNSTEVCRHCLLILRQYGVLRLVAVAPLAHLVCDRCKCHDAWELLYVAHDDCVIAYDLPGS